LCKLPLAVNSTMRTWGIYHRHSCESLKHL
jgi:hypothetical protein